MTESPEGARLTADAAKAVEAAARMDLTADISLAIAPHAANPLEYPSGRIQKGLTLAYKGTDLSEEGVGFGVPVLKRRFDTVFPGSMRMIARSEDSFMVSVAYELNLGGRIAVRERALLKGRPVTVLKEVFALLHRGYPLLRRTLMAVSSSLRRLFAMKTVYLPVDSAGSVGVEYRVDRRERKIHVNVDAHAVVKHGCREIIVMNEQGAHHFSLYLDSDKLALKGQAIESWHEVRAREAVFWDPRHGVSFTVNQRPGARLFRGRELVEGRLAWAGFAYLLPPTTSRFTFEVKIGAGK